MKSNNLRNLIITLLCVVPFVLMIYYAMPIHHVLIPEEQSWTAAFVLLGLFLTAFVMAIIISPKAVPCVACKHLINTEAIYCERCGQPQKGI